MTKIPALEAPRKERSCGTCAYWNDGECRAHPPRVVVGEDESGQQFPFSIWPETEAHEWCGEHEGTW